MRLNGAGLNARALNGAARLPVRFDAESLVALQASGDGRIEVQGSGSLNFSLFAGAIPSTQRRATGSAVLAGRLAGDWQRLLLAPLSAASITIQGDFEPFVWRRASLEAATGASATLSGARGLTSSGDAAFQIEVFGSGSALRRGAGAAIFIEHIDGDWRRSRAATGQGLTALRGELSLTVRRLAPLVAPVVVSAAFPGSVTRAGAGVARLELTTQLFYSRERYGSGACELGLLARADVGVVFIQGQAVAEPALLVLFPNRKRQAPGLVAMAFGGALSPRAIRRLATTGYLEPGLQAALDPAHITSDGVRYLTADARGAFSTDLIDSGLRRRATAGAFFSATIEVTVQGTGSRVRRGGFPHTIVDAQTRIDLTRYQFLPGASAVVSTGASGSGEVFVRGSGAASASVALVGSMRRRAFAQGEASRTVETELTLERHRLGLGWASTGIQASPLEALRYVVGAGFLALRTLSAEAGTTVLRANAGGALIQMRTELGAEIYVRGDGAASIGVFGSAAQAQVLVRGSGTATLPLETRLDGAVFVLGQGAEADPVQLGGQLVGQVFTPIAGESVAPVLSAEGSGEILVRGAGSAVLAVDLEATEPATLYTLIDGEAVVRSPSVGGSGEVFARAEGAAATTIEATFDALVITPVAGTTVLETRAEASGQILVRGGGTMSLPVGASLAATRVRHNAEGVSEFSWALRAEGSGESVVLGEGEPMVLPTATTLIDPLRYAMADGALGMELEVTGSGESVVLGTGSAALVGVDLAEGWATLVLGAGAARADIRAQGDLLAVVAMSGCAVAEVIGESEWFANVDTLDADEQVFVRPAETRTFERPAELREFLRAA